MITLGAAPISLGSTDTVILSILAESNNRSIMWTSATALRLFPTIVLSLWDARFSVATISWASSVFFFFASAATVFSRFGG